MRVMYHGKALLWNDMFVRKTCILLETWFLKCVFFSMAFAARSKNCPVRKCHSPENSHGTFRWWFRKRISSSGGPPFSGSMLAFLVVSTSLRCQTTIQLEVWDNHGKRAGSWNNPLQNSDMLFGETWNRQSLKDVLVPSVGAGAWHGTLGLVRGSFVLPP